MRLVSDFSDFSLDQLIVEEKEVQNPIIMAVTVLVSEISYNEQEDEINGLAEKIKTRLLEKYRFRKDEKRRFRSGFLDFKITGNVVECVYARETPTRIDFEKGDFKINTKRIRVINPSYRVKVRVTVEKTKSKVILFGGNDAITARALTLTNYCIRGCIKGGHSTYQTLFSKENMDKIRQIFGNNIQYVFLSPGESEKLRKMVKKRVKGEVKEILQYFVFAKFAGYRVVVSPLVLELIEEGKIRLLEIEGKLTFGVGKITTRVSSSGRITFFIPDAVIGRDQTAYGIAEELYKRTITRRTGVKQISMEEYFVGPL